MAKKHKDKPMRKLHPDAKHSGEYQDKLANPDTKTLSTNDSHMNRSGGNLSGPTMWGEQSGQEMGITHANDTPF